MNKDDADSEEVLMEQLAALLSDQLEEGTRADLLNYLADSKEARELFLMSFELYRLVSGRLVSGRLDSGRVVSGRDNSVKARQRNAPPGRTDSGDREA